MKSKFEGPFTLRFRIEAEAKNGKISLSDLMYERSDPSDLCVQISLPEQGESENMFFKRSKLKDINKISFRVESDNVPL